LSDRLGRHDLVVGQIPDRLISALRASRHTVVLSGSGISAESGIPPFRDAQTGPWARYRPDELATPEAFERDPALVWQWYQWRRDLIRNARPNRGHMAIAALERLLPRLTLVTQNVDGLHQQAGSRSVIEFNGNIHRNRCSVDNQVVDVDTQGMTKPPRCPSCGARLRPDVVWFGEAIPSHIFMSARDAVSTCDLFISVGTSSIAQPAAGIAEAARAAGAMLVEINPQETWLTSQSDVTLREAAGVTLPWIVAAIG
jgi:NAD-dependent deacetylase